MASKKGTRNDLNAPLRSLSERLRSLQKEAGQLLETVRSDPRPESEGPRPAGRGDLASGVESQLDRVAVAMLERWDIPTRDDLAEIHRRLDRIEAALGAREKPEKTAKTAKTKARTSKSRRSSASAKHT